MIPSCLIYEAERNNKNLLRKLFFKTRKADRGYTVEEYENNLDKFYNSQEIKYLFNAEILRFRGCFYIPNEGFSYNREVTLLVSRCAGDRIIKFHILWASTSSLICCLLHLPYFFRPYGWTLVKSAA